MNVFTELTRSFVPGQDGFLFMWTLAIIALAVILLIIERWVDIGRRTNVDGHALSEKLRKLIREEKHEEAYAICAAGGRRALPRILGAGIRQAKEAPEMIRASMEEETLHMLPVLEKRINFILMFGNISTLIGLMGTIFGLILSFAAVAQPDVEAIEKSSLLAAGISTAMNTTLLGLMISVPCVLIYSIIRSRVDQCVGEIDRYAIGILKALLPANTVQKDYKVTAKRIKQEVDTEPNIAPMMNLMVILIPLLLTSAEFVKIGAIELKLPESSQVGGGGEGANGDENKPAVNLDVGVVIKSSGFDIFHHFNKKGDGKDKKTEDSKGEKGPMIPLVDDDYDYETLNAKLADVKQMALTQLLKSVHPELRDDIALFKLYSEYKKKDYSKVQDYKDHENIKIVAEDTITYQTVVSVMDAARVTKTKFGKVPMFPNVSIAGGIVK